MEQMGAAGRKEENMRITLFIDILLDLIKSQWRNNNKQNMSDTDLLHTYFDLLSNKEISKLYEIYKLDFEQFEYSFQFRGMKYNVVS